MNCFHTLIMAAVLVLAGLLALGCKRSAHKESYPVVHPDNRVGFDVNKPEADSVSVDICGKVYPLEKDAEGHWKGTSDPLEPGFHYYFLLVNGERQTDPRSHTYYGWGRQASGVDIPEPGVDFYLKKDVPHGQLCVSKYWSEVRNDWRTCKVYVPADYLKNQDQRFPVLYLQHGGGEDFNAWFQQGCATDILDNLIAEKKAVPMIIVCECGQVDGFDRILLEETIPTVDKDYRTIPDARHRAMAGLSFGGGQSWSIGLKHPETFSSIGIFSSGMFGGVGPGAYAPFSVESQLPELLSDPEAFNAAHDVFYISCGEEDPRIEFTRTAVEALKAAGADVRFSAFPGDHEWQPWRKSLHEFAQLIFKK